MDIRVIKDESRQDYIASARINEIDFARSMNKRDFYSVIYEQIAFKLADKVIEKIAPAIDKALEELKLEE